MSVPNTDDFTLTDVQEEMGVLVGSLQGAFDKAVGQFDVDYVGDKTKLSNFRNYTHLTFLNVPTNVSCSLVTETTMTLSWEVPVGSAGIDFYKVYKNGVFFANSATTSINITGLPRATQNSWTVTSNSDSILLESSKSRSRLCTTARTLFRVYTENYASSLLKCSISTGTAPIDLYHSGASEHPIVGDSLLLTAFGPGLQFDGDDNWWRAVDIPAETTFKIRPYGAIQYKVLC